MFTTRIKCPRCGSDHVCVEVIKSALFPEGRKVCAGWVNGEAKAYCFDCDEEELATRARQTASSEAKV
jgi:hypothetical protein